MARLGRGSIASPYVSVGAIPLQLVNVIGEPSELEVAQGLGSRKIRAIGQALELGTVQTVGRRHVRAIGQATSETILFGVVREQPIGYMPAVFGILAADAIVASDFAQPVVLIRGRSLVQASETETALAVARRRARGIGQTAESDSTAAVTSRRPLATLIDDFEAGLDLADKWASGSTMTWDVDTQPDSIGFPVGGLMGVTDTNGRVKGTANQVLTSPAGRYDARGSGFYAQLDLSRLTAGGMYARIFTTPGSSVDWVGAYGHVDTGLLELSEGIADVTVGTATNVAVDFSQPVWVRIVHLAASNEWQWAYRQAAGKWLVVRQTSVAKPAPSSARLHFRVDSGGAGAAYIDSIDTGPTVGTQALLGEPAETDLAQPVARVKSRSVGQPTETDSTTTVSRQRVRAIGDPVDTGLAQPAGKSIGKSIGQAVETELSLAVARPPTFPVNQIIETDSAQPVARRKVRTIGEVTSTESAQSDGRQKSRAIGQPLETDLPLTATRRRGKAAGQATETDLDQAFTRIKRLAIGQALEDETAQPLGNTRRISIGQTVETGTVLRLSIRKIIGQTVETDIARPIVARKPIPVAETFEDDLAAGVDRRKSRVLGMAQELDTVSPVGLLFQNTLADVDEVDEAFPVGMAKRFQLGAANETDGARAFITSPHVYTPARAPRVHRPRPGRAHRIGVAD